MFPKVPARVHEKSPGRARHCVYPRKVRGILNSSHRANHLFYFPFFFTVCLNVTSVDTQNVRTTISPLNFVTIFHSPFCSFNFGFHCFLRFCHLLFLWVDSSTSTRHSQVWKLLWLWKMCLFLNVKQDKCDHPPSLHHIYEICSLCQQTRSHSHFVLNMITPDLFTCA